MNTILQRVSYRELAEQSGNSFEDHYSILSGYVTQSVRSALLSNPNYTDQSKSALNLIICDGVIAGRNMLMPTRIKAYDEEYTVQTGGSYEIAEEMRGCGLGKLAFKDSIMNAEYGCYIGQLYSTTAIKIVRKLGLTVFELPSFYKLCKSRSILESKGLHGIPLKVGKTIADAVLKIFDIPNAARLRKVKSTYLIKKENVIPGWINEITLNDGHPYSEVHDDRWMQWCLDNKFTENPNDKQSFYAVYDKQDKPMGFFMTKERHEEKSGPYKNIVRGTIVEWGSFNEAELSEIDLNLLAIDSFGSRVDNITAVLSNVSYEKEMKKLGFIRHGNYQMSIKPGDLAKEDIIDQSKWRIRYGGCNTILV